MKATLPDLPGPDDPDMGEALDRIRRVLAALAYPPPAVGAIVDHCREHRTAEGCDGLRPPDLALVEVMLPADPAWSAAGWDVGHWDLDRRG